MIKRFFRDGLIYTFSTFLTKGIGFLLLPLYTHTFSPKDYGMLDYLTVLGSFIQVLALLECTQGLARFLPEIANKKHEVRKYTSTIFTATVITYIPIIVLLFLFRNILSLVFFQDSKYSFLFLFAAVSYFKNSLVYFLIVHLRSILRVKQSAVISILNGIGTILLSFIFILVLRMGIVGAFLAQIISGLLVFVFGLYINREYIAFSFDFNIYKKLLLFSLPLVPSSIGVMVSLYVDRYAINELMTISDVGVYGFAYRIASSVSLVMVGFQSALSPLIYHHYTEPTTPVQIAEICRYFFILALLIVLFLWTFSKELVLFLAPASYFGASIIIPLLSMAIIISQMYVFFPGLSIVGKTSVLSVLNIVGGITNTILNFLFIPIWGILGATIATFIGNIVLFIGNFYFSNKYYPIPLVLKPIGYSCVGFLMIGILNSFLSSTWLGAIVKVILMGFLIIWFYIVGLITKADLQYIFKLRFWMRKI